MSRLPKADELVGELKEWEFADGKATGERDRLIQAIFSVKKGQMADGILYKKDSEGKPSQFMYRFSDNTSNDTIKALEIDLSWAGYLVGRHEREPLEMIVTCVTVG